MNQNNVAGIQIKDILKSTRLGLFPLPEDVSIEECWICFCCTKKLDVFAVLIGVEAHSQIRVGVCGYCGYMGYIDRPTKAWLTSFYSTDWDKEFMRSTTQMKSDVVLQKGGVKGSRHRAFELHRQIPVDKKKPYFEIGSGYGQVMKNFEIAGFEKLYGIENSKHRVELVKKVFGFEIYHGDFGSREVTEQIKKNGPYGLIFSHHVLEHVYDPNEVVHAMAEMQDEGDYAIFAVPNVAGEHMNYVTLYWPHLHGFTKESLETLFNRHGYEIVIDGSPDILNIILVLRRTKNPKTIFKKRSDYVVEAKKRIRCATGADSLSGGLSALVWEQKITEVDTASTQKIEGGVLGGTLLWYVKQFIAWIKSRIFKRLSVRYNLLVSPVFEKINQYDAFEIQFKKNITFLIK